VVCIVDKMAQEVGMVWEKVELLAGGVHAMNNVSV